MPGRGHARVLVQGRPIPRARVGMGRLGRRGRRVAVSTVSDDRRVELDGPHDGRLCQSTGPWPAFRTVPGRESEVANDTEQQPEETVRERAPPHAQRCKGGHVQRNALAEARLPRVNLEDWECPRFDLLPAPTLKAAATSRCPFHSFKPT